ncbi:MAG TPA: nucleotidyltransferase [Thermoanaerobaculia bacterium]
MAAERLLTETLRNVAAALDEIAAPSMIIGGVAVIAAGVPRETIDVDATISGRDTSIDSVLEVFARHSIVPRIEDAAAFARERQVLLLQDSRSGITIEVSFAWLPFEEQALARSRRIDLGGVGVAVAIPEDLVVYKAAAWRDRDRSDIERLLALHGKAMDIQRVRGLVSEIATALDDPDRIAAFDAILLRTGNYTP